MLLLFEFITKYILFVICAAKDNESSSLVLFKKLKVVTIQEHIQLFVILTVYFSYKKKYGIRNFVFSSIL